MRPPGDLAELAHSITSRISLQPSALITLAVEVGGYHPVQGICHKKKFFLKIQKLKLVLKFLVFFLVSTNNILTFVEDFKSIPVPSKEISSLEVEKIFEFLTLLSFPLVVLLCHTR